MEAEISQAVIRFEKEFMGRGPLETKTYLLDDLVVVRLKGVLTQAELKLAETGEYAAIICLGAVIRGETDHYDHVAGAVTSGVSRVGLDTGVPTIFGILTTDTVEQAFNRAGLKAGNNGYEAAVTAIEMAGLLKAVRPIGEPIIGR